MANFNIPPPDQTNIQEISPPVKFFFKEKRGTRQDGFYLDWLKLILAEKWEVTDLKSAVFQLYDPAGTETASAAAAKHCTKNIRRRLHSTGFRKAGKWRKDDIALRANGANT